MYWYDAPDGIKVYSTYDGSCVRVTWNVPYSWNGISYFNIYQSSFEFSSPTLVGSVNAPGLTFYTTPNKLFRSYSGGGKMQDSRWFYRMSTISCSGTSALSNPVTTIWEGSMLETQNYEGMSWTSIL